MSQVIDFVVLRQDDDRLSVDFYINECLTSQYLNIEERQIDECVEEYLEGKMGRQILMNYDEWLIDRPVEKTRIFRGHQTTH